MHGWDVRELGAWWKAASLGLWGKVEPQECSAIQIQPGLDLHGMWEAARSF
jgi:hypothetical protein